MANIRYDQLTALILPEVQGCSDPMAEQAIRDAAIEFCQRSMVWTHIADPQSIVASNAIYDIEPPSGATLVEIKSIKVSNQTAPLDPMSIDQLDQEYPDWRTATGEPFAFTQVEDAEFILAYVPDTSIDDGLQITLTVQPARNSTGIPEWINNRYQEVILAGAKARLMRKQGTAWYNPQQAADYRSEFDSGIAGAKEDSTLSSVRAAVRTTSRH